MTLVTTYSQPRPSFAAGQTIGIKTADNKLLTWAERKGRNPICGVADYQTGLELTLTYKGTDEFILIMKELLQADKVNALPEVQQYAPIANYCRNSNIIQYAIWIVHQTDKLEVNLKN